MVHYKSISRNQYTIAERELRYKDLPIHAATPKIDLKTCNRSEVYWGDGTLSKATINHLFRVVSGLESGLIGESAIQGQVKAAYEQAREQFQLSKSLHQLFQNALRVGKLVRNQSGISKGAMSHGQATVELIQEHNLNLKNALITLIGVNKLTEDTIRFLQNKGAQTIFVANRSYEKAKPFSEKYGCEILGFKNLKETLAYTDVLISATSASHLIVKKENFPTNKNMLVFDLAFPRDIDPDIEQLSTVQLYNLDQLEKHIKKNYNHRQQEVFAAEEIIKNEIQKFCEKQEMDRKYPLQ